MGGVGIKEILIVLVIIVILFGAKRIPEVMKGMGRGIREFKDGMRDEDKNDDGVEKKHPRP